MPNDSYGLTTLEASGATSVAMSPDEARIYVAQANGTIDVFDTATRAKIATWSVGTSLGGLSVSEDGSFLLVVERFNAPWPNSTSPSVPVSLLFYRVDTSSGAVTEYAQPSVVPPGAPPGFGSPNVYYDVEIVDSQTALLTSAAGRATRFDLATGAYTDIPDFGYFGDHAVMAEDQHLTLLAVQGHWSGPLYLYDDRTGTVVAEGNNGSTPAYGNNFGHQALSEAGGLVAQFVYFNTINLYDLNLNYLRALPVSGSVDGLAFDPTGTYLYVRLTDGPLLQYVAATGALVESFALDSTYWHNNPGAGDQITISDDGKTILVHDNSTGKVQLIDLHARDQSIYSTAANEALAGGRGDDNYLVNDAGDTVVEIEHQGHDTVRSGVNFTLPANIEDLELLGTATIGTGNQLDNLISGNSVSSTLNGGAGDDTLEGGAGNDTLNGGDGSDALRGWGGTNVLNGEAGDDLLLLQGSLLTRVETGTFNGGAGTDTLRVFSGVDFRGTVSSIEALDFAPFSIAELTISSSIMALFPADLVLSGTVNLIVEVAPGGSYDASGFVVAEGSSVTHIVHGGIYGETIVGLGTGDRIYANDGNDTIVGGGGDDHIEGGAGADDIEGGGGADYIHGGNGADAMHGGAGDDHFEVDDHGDTVTENAGEGLDIVVASVTFTLGANVENLQLAGYYVGGTGNDGDNALTSIGTYVVLDGAVGNDVLRAGDSGDTLIGGDGDDSLYGGSGADMLDGGSGNDVIDPGLGRDTVDAGAGDDTIVFGQAMLGGPEMPLGTIDGGSGYDTLDLRHVPVTVGTVTDGTDFFQGFYVGSQRYSITSVELILLGDADNFVGLPWGDYAGVEVRGGGGADDMSGTSELNGLGNRFFGEAGNDRFFITGVYGTTSSGLVDGGDDVDTLALNLGFTVDLALHTGTSADATYTLDNIENVEAFRDSVVRGDDGANAIRVNPLFDDPSGAVQFDGAGGDDTITGSQGSDMLDGSAGADQLLGGNGNDTLNGGVGNDKLVGGAGNDTMRGGLGDDTYVVEDLGDTIVELVGQGSDTLAVGFSHALANGSTIENLATIDAAAITAINLTGNAGVNRLTGNAGANSLNGGGGADALLGGASDDTYLVDNGGDVVTELVNEGTDTIYTTIGYALAAGSEVEVLTVYDRATTNTLSLYGNAVGQAIYGNNGVNLLSGGGGTDTLYGLGGNDAYQIDGAGDVVHEFAGGGNDVVYTTGSFSLSSSSEIELITVEDRSTTNAVNLTGNAFGQTLYGNAGANTLRGGGGTDSLFGFAGNDSYLVDDLTDRVTELAGGGTDTVYTTGNFVLTAGSEIEVLSVYDRTTTSALNLSGNASGQTIYGNAGANSLRGGGGSDVLYGLGGNDAYVVDDLTDQVLELAAGGTDTVYTTGHHVLTAGSEIEVLSVYDRATTNAINLAGNAFANTIYGNAGNNVIDGKAGSDTIYLMGGTDTVFFSTPLGAGNVDALVGFASGNDKLQLNKVIFAGLAPGALPADAFVLNALPADANDRLLYNETLGQLFFDADGNGAGAAVLFATLGAGTALAASDFIVL